MAADETGTAGDEEPHAVEYTEAIAVVFSCSAAFARDELPAASRPRRRLVARRRGVEALTLCYPDGRFMVILVTLVSFLIIAYDLTNRFAPAGEEESPGLFERCTISSALAVILWLASSWVLAIAGLWTSVALAIRAILLAAIAALLLGRLLRARGRRALHFSGGALWMLTLLPLIAWTGFILWRGAVLPPLSHDALSYHLPKAVLFSRAEGFAYLRELDARQRNIPANYEVLLTDVIVTQKDDTFTEWLSALFYLMFVAGAAALAERWWGRESRTAALSVMLTVAAVPVLLLHSGAHKNDTMTAAFIVAGVVVFGRWLRTRQPWALLLLLASMAAAVGTKPQAAGVALFMAPFILFRLFRSSRNPLRTLAALMAFGVFAFLLLGGIVFIANLLEERAVVGRTEGGAVIQYGDWRNLWEGPYVLLAAPFARESTLLTVPWQSSPWFWRKYEIYFSHLGIPFSLCALAAPVVLLLRRRDERSLERHAATFVTVAAFILMMPVVFEPHGMYAISLPRYSLFVVPIVFSWTIAPLALRSAAIGKAVIGAALAIFAMYAVDNGVNDAFAPPDYVRWASDHPGTRQIPFDRGRAASVVDRLAGPYDKIALDTSYSSWIQPAFGAGLTRPIHFIPPGDGPVRIPEDVQWVAIDRGWGIFWGSGAGKDLSDASKYISRGQPSPEELRVRRQLLKDGRFRLRYVQGGRNQLVFERIR
jgi:hypothetical protein